MQQNAQNGVVPATGESYWRMDTIMTESLHKELARFQQLLPELIGEEGKFALIHGSDLVGTYQSYEDALKVGYDRFGLKPFLVKKINGSESVAYFTRDLRSSCPT